MMAATAATASASVAPSASAARQASSSRPRSQQPVARMDTPRGPVRRTLPRTSTIHEANTVAAYGPCASSKKVASTGPVESSRVRKITRRPERTGGVCVATLTPATRISAWLRCCSRVRELVAPSARSRGR